MDHSRSNIMTERLTHSIGFLFVQLQQECCRSSLDNFWHQTWSFLKKIETDRGSELPWSKRTKYENLWSIEDLKIHVIWKQLIQRFTTVFWSTIHLLSSKILVIPQPHPTHLHNKIFGSHRWQITFICLSGDPKADNARFKLCFSRTEVT